MDPVSCYARKSRTGHSIFFKQYAILQSYNMNVELVHGANGGRIEGNANVCSVVLDG